ncbi:MAG: VWA domain-containing protein [Acidimicrobiales bacterium]|nr:VWA domain-containing protein [Acidimicrobiales bacterium]
MAADIEAVAVTMARTLRRLGVAAPPDTTVAYAAALAEVGVDQRGPAYWAGRATLVHRPEDVPTYDRVFAAIFGGPSAGHGDADPEVVEQLTVLLDTDEDDGSGDDATPVEGPTVRVRWSDREVLQAKDFAACTAAELDEAHRLMADLRVVGARRRSRRLRASRRSRGAIDLRATSRRALRTGGEPLRTVHREPGHRLRRLVLLCDVSGSMEAYARELVRFAHTAVAGRTQVEVFTIGTRCTRITRQLRSRDPDAAMRAAASAVDDWSGGTRLGAGLRAFNDMWGVKGMARGATVVILSDGWDRGDPDELAAQVRRLHLVAHKLIWVNPLKVTPGFEPVARGMAAALPHVDELVEGHSLGSLESLAELIRR